MSRVSSLVVGIAIAIGALAGAPVSRAAVNTIYLGDAVHTDGGSCADPDFSSAGGFSAAMMAALASIDADGDTLVICNGDYTLTDVVEYDSEHSFTVRAESRRQVTIGGSTIFMSGCSPAVTVVGMHFDEIGEGFFCGEEDMYLTVLDSEFSGGGAVAWLGGDGLWGRLRIVDSHIHHMTEIAIAYAGSIELYNSVYEQNVSVVGLYAPFTLEFKRSRVDYNLGELISVGVTSCLTVERSTLTANGQPNDIVPEIEPGFMSGATLLTVPFFIDSSCGSNVSDSRFKDNVAALGGALVFIEPSAATVVKNNLFSGNRGLMAGAVGLCSDAPSRQIQTLARRIGYFKVNRYRGNEAVDRRANNVFLLTTTGDFEDLCTLFFV